MVTAGRPNLAIITFPPVGSEADRPPSPGSQGPARTPEPPAGAVGTEPSAQLFSFISREFSRLRRQFPNGIVSSVSFVSTTNTARSLAGVVSLALALTPWRSPGSSEKRFCCKNGR